MIFTSFAFLSIFLPIVLFVYYFPNLNLNSKNNILLIFSAVFIAWGGLLNLFLVIYVSIVAYYGSKYLIRKKSRVRLFLVISILLSNLIYFKYSVFILENINELFRFVGSGKLSVPEIMLPIGISFFTFQAITYVVDVYRGESQEAPSLRVVTLYIILFPQLVAGPIVNYHDVNSQILNRSHNFDEIIYGIKRFIIGMAKKVIIADTLAKLVDEIYLSGQWTLISSWIFAFGYTFQIYFDFSGYSDMAIGLGKMFGFTFKENFNYPYTATSVTDFWRKWHISLSTFFKNYVYIPLGGNRLGIGKTIRNLIVIFLLTGIFHGAKWSFVVWGVWHGIFILVEKLTKFQSRVLTFVVVVFGWVIFRADTLQDTLQITKAMIGLNVSYTNGPFSLIYAPKYIITFILAFIFSSRKKWQVFHKENYIYDDILNNGIYLGVFFLVLLFMINSTYHPFIYFRF